MTIQALLLELHIPHSASTSSINNISGSVCIAVAKASLTCMIDIFLCREIRFKSHPKFKERGYFSIDTDRTPV
ncbi:MAG: hypothetical protein Q8M95_14300, partial [Candidatus Methanoperedens sp.]|nr:hypothetical protein [Candidatus Methanoperedens sp.]